MKTELRPKCLMFLLFQVCYIQEACCRNLSLMRLVSMGKTDLKLDYLWW